MPFKENTRREFLKAGSAALAATALASNASSYAAIAGANDRVRVGVVGCGDRMSGALIPAFLQNSKDMNFQIVAVSDIWNRRREEGAAFIEKLCGNPVDQVRNNDELYARKDVDAVIIATADFQHALARHRSGQRRPRRLRRKAHRPHHGRRPQIPRRRQKTGKIVQVGTQRRSTPAYMKAAEYIKSGTVRRHRHGRDDLERQSARPLAPSRRCAAAQGGRHRLEALSAQSAAMSRSTRASISSSASSGLTPPAFPISGSSTRSTPCIGSPACRIRARASPTAASTCGRTAAQNWDTMTAVFDYGPLDDLTKGFQVQYTSRFTNSAGGVKELYYSNGGMIDMDKQTVTPTGGLTRKIRRRDGHEAQPAAQLLARRQGRERSAPTPTPHADPQTSANMRNWMECVRSRKTPNASDRSRLQPLHRALHERGRHPDRPEGHLRRKDAAGDGRRQGL